jgi:hypothetical protein
MRRFRVFIYRSSRNCMVFFACVCQSEPAGARRDPAGSQPGAAAAQLQPLPPGRKKGRGRGVMISLLSDLMQGKMPPADIGTVWNLLILAFIVYRFWQSRQPFPETGGRVSSVKSMADWKALVSKAAAEKKVICAEFYATW